MRFGQDARIALSERGAHRFHLKSFMPPVCYHLLWGDVGELVRQACEAFEIRVLKGVVSKDHVHILMSALPELAPSEMMRRIKRRTASKLFGELPALKKRYRGQHFWRRTISVRRWAN